MPIDYSRYPANWSKEIVPTVLARAGEQRDSGGKVAVEAKCEWCQVKNHTWYHRLRNGVVAPCYDKNNGKDGECWYCQEGHESVRIVLTIAHLDHDADNHDVCTHRLKALCQRCHNHYDAPMRRARAFETRNRKKGQTLMEGIDA